MGNRKLCSFLGHSKITQHQQCMRADAKAIHEFIRLGCMHFFVFLQIPSLIFFHLNVIIKFELNRYFFYDKMTIAETKICKGFLTQKINNFKTASKFILINDPGRT